MGIVLGEKISLVVSILGDLTVIVVIFIIFTNANII